MQHAVFEEWNNEGDAILLRDISSYSIDFRNTSSMGLLPHKNIHKSSCEPFISLTSNQDLHKSYISQPQKHP
jgi:hypothetical protein